MHITVRRSFLALILVAFAAVAGGCSVNVKAGDPLSVEHWKMAQNRQLGDWAEIMGLTRSEALALTEEDFPMQISLTRGDGVVVETELDWFTWSATRDGFLTFQEYEEDKLEAEEKSDVADNSR